MVNSAELKNQLIGLVRFSYPAKNGFNQRYETEQELCAALYAPERMALRFELLEKLCAPSLRNQSDQDFKVVFLTGQQMPAEYKARLEGVIADIPGAVIIAQQSNWMFRATQQAYQRVTDEGAQYVTTFRLDDDDAMAVDFVAKVRDRAGRMIAGRQIEQQPAILAYTNGLYWQASNGMDGFTHVLERTPLGLSCAMVAKRGMPENVFRRDHRKFGCFFPTLLDPTEIMFIRSVHGYNDSGDKSERERLEISQESLRRVIESRFGLNPENFIAG